MRPPIDAASIYPSHPGFQFFHEIFEASAEKFPDRIALRYGNHIQFTYSELNSIANRFANYFIDALGIKPGNRVVVFLDKSPQQIISLLAIFKVGAVFVPLEVPESLEIDPHSKHWRGEERLKAKLKHIDSRMVITQKTHHVLLDSLIQVQRLMAIEKRMPGQGLICLDLDDSSLIAAINANASADANPPRKINPEQNPDAYIYFTSGSTGVPKGVLVGHEGLPSRLHEAQTNLNITENDVVCQFCPFDVDASLMEIMMALGSGGCLNMIPPAFQFNMARLHEYFNLHGITLVPMIPSFHRLLEPSHFTSLRVLITTGENLTQEDLDRWQRCPSIEIVCNGHGPHEATIALTFGVYYRKGRGSSPNVHIGKPLTGTNIVIQDDTGRLFNHESSRDAECSGELLIGGIGVAKGYLDQSEPIEKKFITLEGQRFYRSGDRVKFDQDGNLIFLERMDQKQVKFTGKFTASGEIERILRLHRLVKSVKITEEHNRLLADLVFNDPSNAQTEPSLRKHLALCFEHPPAVHFLASGNWKGRGTRLLAEEERVVVTEIIEKLKQIYQDIGISSIEEIDPQDTFENLGGTSYQATFLKKRLLETYPSVDTADDEIFNQQLTISQLANYIDQRNHPDRLTHPLSQVAIAAADQSSLFLIHSITGNAISDYLRRILEQDEFSCNVYAISAPGLANPNMMPASIEDMAKQYIAYIRLRQPKGPYLIAGWSLGGVIAYAIGGQLQASGEAVSITMLDSIAPMFLQALSPEVFAQHMRWVTRALFRYYFLASDLAPAKVEDVELPRQISDWLEGEDFLRLNPVEQTNLVIDALRMLNDDDGLDPGLKTYLPSRVKSNYKSTVPSFINSIELVRKIALAELDYEVKATLENVFLLRAERQYFDEIDIDLGWGPGVTVIDVKGDHFTMLSQDAFTELKAIVMRESRKIRTQVALSHGLKQQQVCSFTTVLSMVPQLLRNESFAVADIYVDLKLGDKSTTHSMSHHNLLETSDTVTVQIEELFDQKTHQDLKKNAQHVALIGVGGSGKSTLLKRIFVNVNQEHLWHDQVDLALLISLSEFGACLAIQQQHMTSVEEMLTHVFEHKLLKTDGFDDRETVNQFFKFIVDELPRERILILLDGWDEIEALTNDSRSIFYSNLNLLMNFTKRAKSFSTLRPNALPNSDLLRCDRTIEVEGFSEDQVREYIGKVEHNSTIAAEAPDLAYRMMQLKGRVEYDRVLMSLMQIPVMAEIICHLYFTRSQCVFHTLKISTLILYVVDKFTERLFVRPSFSSYPEEMKETLSELLFTKLSDIAYDVRQRGLTSFTLGEFLTRGKTLSTSDIVASGFIRAQQKDLVLRNPDEKQYTFPHSVVAEHFVAAKLATNFLSPSQIKYNRDDLDHHLLDPDWRRIWFFVAGRLGKDHAQLLLRELLNPYSDPIGFERFRLLLHCFEEAWLWPTRDGAAMLAYCGKSNVAYNYLLGGIFNFWKLIFNSKDREIQGFHVIKFNDENNTIDTAWFQDILEFLIVRLNRLFPELLRAKDSYKNQSPLLTIIEADLQLLLRLIEFYTDTELPQFLFRVYGIAIEVTVAMSNELSLYNIQGILILIMLRVAAKQPEMKGKVESKASEICKQFIWILRNCFKEFHIRGRPDKLISGFHQWHTVFADKPELVALLDSQLIASQTMNVKTLENIINHCWSETFIDPVLAMKSEKPTEQAAMEQRLSSGARAKFPKLPDSKRMLISFAVINHRLSPDFINKVAVYLVEENALSELATLMVRNNYRSQLWIDTIIAAYQKNEDYFIVVLAISSFIEHEQLSVQVVEPLLSKFDPTNPACWDDIAKLAKLAYFESIYLQLITECQSPNPEIQKNALDIIVVYANQSEEHNQAILKLLEQHIQSAISERLKPDMTAIEIFCQKSGINGALYTLLVTYCESMEVDFAICSRIFVLLSSNLDLIEQFSDRLKPIVMALDKSIGFDKQYGLRAILTKILLVIYQRYPGPDIEHHVLANLASCSRVVLAKQNSISLLERSGSLGLDPLTPDIDRTPRSQESQPSNLAQIQFLQELSKRFWHPDLAELLAANPEQALNKIIEIIVKCPQFISSLQAGDKNTVTCLVHGCYLIKSVIYHTEQVLHIIVDHEHYKVPLDQARYQLIVATCAELAPSYNSPIKDLPVFSFAQPAQSVYSTASAFFVAARHGMAESWRRTFGHGAV